MSLASKNELSASCPSITFLQNAIWFLGSQSTATKDCGLDFQRNHWSSHQPSSASGSWGYLFCVGQKPEIMSFFSSQAFLHGQVPSYLSESLGNICHLLICNAGNWQKYLYLIGLSDSFKPDRFEFLYFFLLLV